MTASASSANDMVVVDTNILVGLLIDGPFTATALALREADADWHSEPFILVEFANVLATQVRAKRAELTDALLALHRAQHSLGLVLHAVDHGDALALASGYGVSAYDARYLALARALGQRLITEDAALRRKAPALTQSLAEALAAPPTH